MILPISLKHCLCEPFTDYANISTPKQNRVELISQIQPFLDVLGALQIPEVEGLYVLPKKGGSFKVSDRAGVSVFSASGGVLDRMRANRMLDSYLTVFSEFEHNVSMMHATVDYAIDSPEILEAIYQKATSGQFYLSRKALNPMHVSRLTGKNIEGDETGTVYLGNRQNYDIWAKAYDKRQERLAKGFADCGPMLRIEIAVQTDVGATLRDISNPHDIYYHFANKSLVEAPKGFNGWVTHANGYTLEKQKTDFTTWQKLWGIIENSNDFKRVIDLAIADYGNDASKEIEKLVRKRISLRERAMAF